jgi:small nuclear ribonucleoprotein (snRNP)-like protein
MKNALFILIGFLALLSPACLPPSIDIDVEPAPPKLCIASVVMGNNGIVIGLTRSYSPLQQDPNHDTLSDDLVEQILVTGATVTISYGANTDTLYEVAPGVYTNLLTTITEGETYTLRAYDPQMNLSCQAVTVMRPEVALDTVYPYIVRNHPDTMVYFHYKLQDNTAAENYYVVNFIKKVQGDSTFDINSIFAAGSNEVLTEFELLDDQAFTNGVLEKDVHVFSAEQHDTVAVTVSEISKGYYEFLTAMKRSSSIFNQLTGEPITYPSNVEGGHGYFTMHRTNSDLFDLNLY